MELSETERSQNDMTKTGVWCINNTACQSIKLGEQMEKVTGEERYTCHYCGAVIEVHFKGH